jgi:hypothetical protein
LIEIHAVSNVLNDLLQFFPSTLDLSFELIDVKVLISVYAFCREHRILLHISDYTAAKPDINPSPLSLT